MHSFSLVAFDFQQSGSNVHAIFRISNSLKAVGLLRESIVGYLQYAENLSKQHKRKAFVADPKLVELPPQSTAHGTIQRYTGAIVALRRWVKLFILIHGKIGNGVW